MKYKFTILALCLVIIKLSAQPTWNWAVGHAGNNWEYGFGLTTDMSGNSISTGYYQSSPLAFGSTTLTNPGSGSGARYFYLAKHDPNGNVLWAKSGAGTGENNGKAVSRDASGNIYVAGDFTSPTFTLGSFVLTNAGGADIFVAKFDQNGNVLWATRAGGNFYDEGKAISTDANGFTTVTGGFQSASISFGTFTLTNPGNSSMFVVRFDPAGNVVWAKTSVGTAFDAGYGVAMDATGNSYVTGGVSSPTVAFGTQTLSTAGGADIFITKYDILGNAVWAKRIGGSNYEEGYAAAVDADNNLIIAGGFASSSITTGATVLTTSGGWDILTVKYDPSGNVLWSKKAGGSSDDIAFGLATDQNKNVALTGYFRSTVLTVSTGNTLTKAGGDDIFVLMYDMNGNPYPAARAGGVGNDYGSAIAFDQNHNPVLTGVYSAGNASFGTYTLTNIASGDIFVAKLNGGPLEVNEVKKENTVRLFPNPAYDKLVVNSESSIDQIRVYNILGELIQNQEVKATKTQISVDGLTPGVYFVVVHSSEGESTIRFVKN